MTPLPATRENTVFLAIAAYKDYEQHTFTLRKTAEKCGIPLLLCDQGERWQGFYRHKIEKMQSHLENLFAVGKRFAFILDGRDVAFIDPLDVVLRKFNKLNRGRAIFNHDVPGKIWPSHNETLQREIAGKVHSEHPRLNAGMIASDIVTLLKIQAHATAIRDSLLSGKSQDAFVRKIHHEIGAAHHDDDQHLYQICLACYPEMFHIDCERELFAVIMSYPNVMHEHSNDPTRHDVIHHAAILHSPWLSRGSDWNEWTLEIATQRN